MFRNPVTGIVSFALFDLSVMVLLITVFTSIFTQPDGNWAPAVIGTLAILAIIIGILSFKTLFGKLGAAGGLIMLVVASVTLSEIQTQPGTAGPSTEQSAAPED